uniref:Replication protein A 70 kDa DNA-binding subunit n=1 Tax=Dracunculus medinensis TaxID=318479 RepID=A0A158Q667_DRAME
LGRGLPIFNNPTEHSGDPNDYKGFNPNRLQSVTADDDISHYSSVFYQIFLYAYFFIRSMVVLSHFPSIEVKYHNDHWNYVYIYIFLHFFIFRWRICGVVSVKEDLRELKTARGDMRVFNFEITDKDGGCIRVAAFNEIADKYYSIIQKGVMYYVVGGTIKQANKRFNTTGHDYEISLRSDSEQKIVQPKLVLNGVSLAKIASFVNECVDVIGIIESVADIQQVTSRSTGQILEKRDLMLIDQSGTTVALTFWGEQARKYDKHFEHQTVGIKGALVREYNGQFFISLSTLSSSRIEFNPDCRETSMLYSWYKNMRPSIKTNTIELGKNDEKGAYFNVTAIISTVKADGALYKSCGNGGCKKKVIAMENQYRCEKCNILLDTYKYMEISDFSGTHYVTVFEDKAAKLLKISAEELGVLLDNDQEYNKIFNAILFRQYNFRIRAKSEFYNVSLEQIS